MSILDRLHGIRRLVAEYRGRILVGEVYLLDLQRVVTYLITGNQLHVAHNFVFLHLPWNARRSVLRGPSRRDHVVGVVGPTTSAIGKVLIWFTAAHFGRPSHD